MGAPVGSRDGRQGDLLDDDGEAAPAGRACRWGAAGSRRATTRCGAPRRGGALAPTQSRASSRARVPTTNATTRLPHSSSGTPSTSAAATAGCSPQPRGDRGAGTFTPPVTTTSSTRPSTDSRPSSSIRPASDVRYQPSTRVCAGQHRVVDVPLNRVGPPIRIRPPSPIATADAVERQAVVDAAARGLRGAVRRHHVDAGRGRPARGAAGSIGPPPRSTVCARRSAATAVSSSSSRPSWVGTRETNQPSPVGPAVARRAAPARGRRPATGRSPGRPRRTSAAAPAPTGPSPRAGAPTPRPRPAPPPGSAHPLGPARGPGRLHHEAYVGRPVEPGRAPDRRHLRPAPCGVQKSTRQNATVRCGCGA